MASRFLIDLVLLLALGSMDFTDPTGSLVYYPWLYHEYNVRKISFPVLGTTKTYSFAGRVDYLIILLELPNSRLVGTFVVAMRTGWCLMALVVLRFQLPIRQFKIRDVC